MRVRQLIGMLLGLLAFVVFDASSVVAQEPAKGGDKAKTEPKVLDFEGDVIETSFLKPESSLIEGETRKAGGSLLKIRQDFIAEIVKSAEDI